MLPKNWVDRIFARLLVRYGAAWLRMWDGIDIEAVKADWARELGHIQAETLAYALEHLPAEKPPTVGQFLDICRRAPVKQALRLVGPVANRERVDAEVAKLKNIRNLRPDPLATARELRRREQAGDRSLTMAQRDYWRIALRREIDESGAA